MNHDLPSKLSRERVAIVGVGGTGSHILDFICRMPVEEIHLFDGDILKEKNVSRSPGVVKVSDDHDKIQYKADLYAARYSSVNPKIQGTAEYIDDKNVEQLARYTTIFLSIDGGRIKRRILEICKEYEIVLVNVGMGVFKGQNHQLSGLVGVTLCLPNGQDHVEHCFDIDEPSRLADNHQTIELNALNAALAVIRWKKHIGIYADDKHKLDMCYSIANNVIYNKFEVT